MAASHTDRKLVNHSPVLALLKFGLPESKGGRGAQTDGFICLFRRAAFKSHTSEVVYVSHNEINVINQT